MLAANESFETDTPGLRIRCEAASWRMVATNLVVTVGRIPLDEGLYKYRKAGDTRV